MLRARGAFVVDADELAREVVALGTEGHRAVVAVFGPGILAASGEIDRARLGRVVFADPTQLERLEAVVHPLVDRAAAERFATAPAGVPLIYEVPLVAETGSQQEFAAIIVVDAPAQVRVSRLVARGLAEPEALRRMAAQVDEHARLAMADVVLDNRGGEDELERQVDELFPRLQALG